MFVQDLHQAVVFHGGAKNQELGSSKLTKKKSIKKMEAGAPHQGDEYLVGMPADPEIQ